MKRELSGFNYSMRYFPFIFYFILFNFLVVLYTRTHQYSKSIISHSFSFLKKINLSIFITIFIYLTGIYHCLDFRYIIIHIQTY